MSELTAEQCCYVPCPQCGVPVGKPCLLHSGAVRSEAHIDRRLSVAEEIEMKRIPRVRGRQYIPAKSKLLF
jgi:hypothetical protein